MQADIFSPETPEYVDSSIVPSDNVNQTDANVAQMSGKLELSSRPPVLHPLSLKGDRNICIAILDGPVDRTHPCFKGAELTALPTLVPEDARSDGRMSGHGTHVASIIFGQPDTCVPGIAPQCKGLIIPVFADDRRNTTQLDLARGIEQAVNAGAHVINISGGQLTDFGEAEGWLENAVRLCQQRNVLLVAAAGNDGCNCLHVPAALPTVLAVGAMNARGHPLDFSNWGDAYQQQGILAPGEDILGAKPGGGTEYLSGTSFATPIVSGVVALLLSEQVRRGEIPNPQKVRQLLLQSARPCDPDLPELAQRCLAGKLNGSGAFTLLTGENMLEELAVTSAPSVEASGNCGCNSGLVPDDSTAESDASPNQLAFQATAASPEPQTVPSLAPSSLQATPMTTTIATPSQVKPSQAPSELADSQFVFTIGTVGYDFGSEARRDSFKQLMPPQPSPPQINPPIMVPPNPYDARQMVEYLQQNPSEARSLIWTLNLELTPIYAIEPVGAFSSEVYALIVDLLAGQILNEDDENYIERVSIPAVLTGRTVKLFSGQVVPVIQPQSPRGIYGWKVNDLIPDDPDDELQDAIQQFLNRVYYDLRNLGTTSQDRAVNFAVTNIFQTIEVFQKALQDGKQLDTITVEKSPFCRADSDCWDVKLKFFDPENNQRAKRIFRFTIDVSDLTPVSLGKLREWSSSY